VGSVLKQLNVGPEALFSTLGRSRGAGPIETLLIAEKMRRLGQRSRREHGGR
jgi:hypothetical protein